MNVGDKFRVKRSVGEYVHTAFGYMGSEVLAGKVGEFIGLNPDTHIPVLDFGSLLGPHRLTCDIAEEHLEVVK